MFVCTGRSNLNALACEESEVVLWRCQGLGNPGKRGMDYINVSLVCVWGAPNRTLQVKAR